MSKKCIFNQFENVIPYFLAALKKLVYSLKKKPLNDSLFR